MNFLTFFTSESNAAYVAKFVHGERVVFVVAFPVPARVAPMLDVPADVMVSLGVLLVAKNAEKFFLEKALVGPDGVNVIFFGLRNVPSEEEKRVEIVGFQSFPWVHGDAVVCEFQILICRKYFDENFECIFNLPNFFVTAWFLGTD